MLGIELAQSHWPNDEKDEMEGNNVGEIDLVFEMRVTDCFTRATLIARGNSAGN